MFVGDLGSLVSVEDKQNQISVKHIRRGLRVHGVGRRYDVKKRDRDQDATGKADKIGRVVIGPSFESADRKNPDRGHCACHQTRSERCPKTLFHLDLD